MLTEWNEAERLFQSEQFETLAVRFKKFAIGGHESFPFLIAKLRLEKTGTLEGGIIAKVEEKKETVTNNK